MKQLNFINKKVLTEEQINLIKRRLNNHKLKVSDLKPITEGEGYKITKEQTEKTLKWLWNLYQTERGIERKNNPFGYREIEVLKNFKEFVLKDFYNDINTFQAQSNINNFLLLWLVVSKDGTTFEYYNNYKGISIVG